MCSYFASIATFQIDLSQLFEDFLDLIGIRCFTSEHHNKIREENNEAWRWFLYSQTVEIKVIIEIELKMNFLINYGSAHM